MKSILIFFILILLLQLAESAKKGSGKGKGSGKDSTATSKDPCKPKQIHIALSDAFATYNSTTDSTMKVIFHTQEECSSAYITLKTPKGGNKKIQATAVNFFHDKLKTGNYSTYVHVFDFKNLNFAQTYEYTCHGSDNKDLDKPQGPFQFYVPTPKKKGQQTQVVMFADMDHSKDGNHTISKLAEIAQNNFTNISAFIHYGDMAYNMKGSGGKKGDRYMKAVQKFAATMPYMVTAGNHETTHNFSLFNMRFQMPMFDQSQNHYYSFNLGNMHFVSWNLDLVIKKPHLENAMLDWLEQDLQNAALNRANQPWIIAYTHRPLYCSYGNDPDCTKNHEKFSKFEDLLLKYNVDLLVAGHVHFYERMLPIRRGAIAPFQQNQGDTNFNEIINPQGPVHILQGMAGHKGDKADPKEIYKGKAWTVKVSKAYSFLSVKSSNSTHLLVENFESKTGNVNDYFYVIKSNSLKYAKVPMAKLTNLRPSSNSAWQLGSSLLALIFVCLYLFV